MTKKIKSSCTDCYTFTPNENAAFEIFSSSNKLKGFFKIREDNFVFTDIKNVTDIEETEEGERFVNYLKKVRSYKISDNGELLLYYSDVECLVFV